MSKLVRVSEEIYSKLTTIAKNNGSSKQAILEAALEKWEIDTIFKQANEAYAAMRKTDEWQNEQEELALWDSTLEDGLCDDE